MQPGPFRGTSAPPGGVSLDHLRARLGSLVVLRVSRGGLGVGFGTKIDDLLMVVCALVSWPLVHATTVG